MRSTSMGKLVSSVTPYYLATLVAPNHYLAEGAQGGGDGTLAFISI